jgi:hypothetical protein
MPATARWLLGFALFAIVPVTAAADILHLRNGSRLHGDLIAVRGGTIEFEERRSSGGGRTVRVDRSEVVRIELDPSGVGGWGGESGFASGRPSGMRERSVTVSATEPWTDTGVTVRPGQAIYVEAGGQVRWGRDRRDSPAGERNSPYNAARPLPNRPGAALIGRIGDDVFFIGDASGPIRTRSGGRLMLGINDEHLVDNSGHFRVTVFY